jgi:DNA-3-methyladenine glycosylase II
VVAYPPDSSARPSGVPAPTTSTGNILKDAQEHLIKQAPSLAALIEKHECNLFTSAGLVEVIDPFQSLTSALISQQITGAAAKSIKARLHPTTNLHIADIQ